MDAIERIVWSADVADEQAVLGHLGLMPDLRYVKIDRLYTDRHGRFILTDLRERGFQVFYDAKFVEIPSKLEDLALEALKHKPWMINTMAGTVSNMDMSIYEKRDLMDGLKRFSDVCLNVGTLPCGVTVLTSKTDETVAAEFNDRSATDQVLWYVEMLIRAEFTDVVCSPLEVSGIRQRFGDVIDLDTPGVRFADSDADDQARIATPGGAIAMGSTRNIMGRPLHDGWPEENLARAVQEIAAVQGV